jgi:N-acetylglutamate synthase
MSRWFSLRMQLSADTLATVMVDFYRELLRPAPDALVIRSGGAAAMISGATWPTHNLVWLERSDAAMVDVASLLDEVIARGVPFVLEGRPGNDEVTKLAASYGMTLEDDIPLMVVDSPAAVSPPENLAVRQLAPDEVETHVVLSAESFETPEAVYRQNVAEDVLKNGAVRCYVGELDGLAVATGMSITTGGFTGILDVVTDPRHRGRGFGTAITARAVADGLAAGASWCWLQSSAQGYPVYKSLGFQPVESWPFWVSASGPR